MDASNEIKFSGTSSIRYLLFLHIKPIKFHSRNFHETIMRDRDGQLKMKSLQMFNVVLHFLHGKI